jgi:hypothetical protein
MRNRNVEKIMCIGDQIKDTKEGGLHMRNACRILIWKSECRQGISVRIIRKCFLKKRWEGMMGCM